MKASSISIWVFPETLALMWILRRLIEVPKQTERVALVERPPPQEVRIVEQERLCHSGQITTIALGHRPSSLCSGSQPPAILEDGGHLRHPATLFTELYGHNRLDSRYCWTTGRKEQVKGYTEGLP
jgi:hypothetical protein